MKPIKQIVEEINSLLEDDIAEINLQDEIEPKEIDVKEEPLFNDTMTLADQFDAKARIARALEALKDAVEEFKNATAEKIDLLKDQALNIAIENLDNVVVEIEKALACGSKILGDCSLNDPFKTEMPDEVTEEEKPEEAEEEYEERDFDAEAGLDLLNNEA